MENNQISKLELIQAQVSFIPDGWKLDKVGKTLVIKNTFRKPISQEVRSKIPGCYPYYGPTKIQDYISDYEQDGVYALIGEDGDHFLKYSTMRQTQFISGKCTVNNHAHIIESSDECDSEWFYIFFKHRNITNFLSRQGAGRFKLNKATLEKLPLLVPPLPEQRKIANILGTWDTAISTTERLIDNSKQQKKALMQQLLTGAHTQRKRLLDDSGKPFEGEWEEVKLGDVCKPQQWATVSSKDLLDEGYPVYGANGHIGFYSEFNHEDESVAVTCRGSTCGEVSLIPEHSYITGNAMCLDDIDSAKHNYLFIYYALSRRGFIDVISGSAQPQIIGKAIRGVKFKMPDVKEQQKIALVLTSSDNEIELLETKLTHFKQEKKALMQQLLTGKRRVTIDEVEVA
jgi:type I restriction enzyme S subunit